MKRSTLLYALALTAIALALKTAELHYQLVDITTEFYVGIIALCFTILGLWIGRKLASDRPAAAEAPVPAVVRTGGIDHGLTPRESEVLRLIAAGHSNQQIADHLYLSLNTVKKHTSMLLRKLEAERRTQAIEKARRLGLIE